MSFNDLQLHAKDGATTFRGFLIHAKKGGEFIGEFGIDEAVGHFVSCSEDHPKAAVTHADSDDKSAVTLTWFGPDGVDANSVEFPFTVVEEKVKFWINVSKLN